MSRRASVREAVCVRCDSQKCKRLSRPCPHHRHIRRLSRQLKERKVIVKLFLRHSLHAKLYLTYHQEERHPIDAYLGSSNLTFAGLSMQGELNTELSDFDACEKLEKWFQARWDDRWCLDITDELIKVIDESWARADALRPYDVYLKMA